MYIVEYIRLVGGSGPHEGRVEVYYNETWGTVCDDNFDLNDAKVVCRQLGYDTAIRYRPYAYFGQGNDPIWLDYLRCTGTETSLHHCHRNDYGVIRSCSHAEDVGVVCPGIT